MSIKSLAVLTSGGDAPGMNAAIRAVVRAGIFYKKEVFGVHRGYDGLIEGDFEPLYSKSVKNILAQGGTMLKSARSAEFRHPEGRAKAAQQLRDRGIDGLVVIGGDGTFTGAHLLAEEHGIAVVGIPGTIDNDLFGTDYTIGYDTATNTVVECIDKIRDTANSHNRMFIVEVMGRDAGFIALSAGVATGALDIVLPEKNTTLEDLYASIDRGAENKKTSNIIVVAEGNRLGKPFDLAKSLGTRYPELDIKVTILGHIQRGGSPSALDRVNASQLGVAAVESLLNGKSDIMVGMVNGQMTHTFLQQAIYNKAPLDMELFRVSKILSI
ncbi:MAG: 6-phosphofructokinase [Bacteroidetes bacterium]|jgi:6-phosphofructokinase 1|nr:MAG: 6-phosphofructokinase [Cryomorphaceae bacterium BACL23 MAG-120924-bin60]MBL6627458.1 6-phosphofructokinase [Cryomorphaceae bacterium]MDA0363616.1 6-phosphofructokinase [Bacteroidota bacterium]MDA0828402.1 6-phosphofructokinase [Bacteroidota bacterium]MDA1199359.1 6-phosphofructokinase [Bacteroidota bacterium]